MATIDAIAGSAATASAGNGKGFSALSADDFTKLIFTELSHQDPLQPNDTNQLLQQVQSIRNIQSDLDLSSNLKGVANQYEFSAATTLIGRKVSGVSDDAGRVEGVVKSVSRTDQGAVVTLADGSRVRMSNLDQVVQSGT